MATISEIENLLDLEDSVIKSLYNSWDKGDCSVIGLIEILLVQEIQKHKLENGADYDTDYDSIKLRYNFFDINGFQAKIT